MDRPDLPLNGLRVFEAAYRQGSFTRAAIELRVTQAAVSHQVARLEDRLGVALFVRASGGLVPTDEGRALYPVLEHGFDAMARTLDRITGHRHIETLKIGVVTTFAVGWLMPRLPEFRRTHPAIDLRISTNNNRVEILREGLDMAIRYGTGSWTGLEADLLLDAPLAPLCAPSIAKYLTNPELLAVKSCCVAIAVTNGPAGSLRRGLLVHPSPARCSTRLWPWPTSHQKAQGWPSSPWTCSRGALQTGGWFSRSRRCYLRVATS